MGLFTKGTATVRRAFAMGPVPERDRVQEGLNKDRFRPFGDGSDEKTYGWAHWANIEKPAALDSSEIEDCYVFAMRVDTRKVPGSLLKIRLNSEIEKRGFLDKKARAALKDEIKEELLREIVPTPKAVDVAWDFKKGVVYTSATSRSDWSDLAELFSKSWGLDLMPMDPGGLAGHLVKPVLHSALKEMEPIDFSEEASGYEGNNSLNFLGTEFAAWLWHQATVHGGTSGQDGDETALLIEDAMQLISSRGDVQEATLKKGNPSASAAAFEALREGMRVVRMKFSMNAGESIWMGSLVTPTLDISGLKIPLPKEMVAYSPAHIAQARLEALMVFFGAFDLRFKAFLDQRVEDPDALCGVLNDWVMAGVEGLPEEEGVGADN